MRRKVLAASVLALALALTGCHQQPAPHATAETSLVGLGDEDVTVTPSSPPPSPDASLPPADATPSAQGADAESCQPVDTELLNLMKFSFGTPTATAMVKVGPGNDPNETWWIVSIVSPPDDAYKWGERNFLTNAPTHRDPDTWTWIALEDSDPWAGVKWDEAKLILARQALVQAKACLRAWSH